MKIVVLDEIAFTEEQLKRLKSMGQVDVYEHRPLIDMEIIERCQDADIVLTGWTVFNKEVLSSLKGLKFIALWSTGYDQIDLQAARENNIMVANLRGYAKNAVGELAVGLMLAVYRKITLSDKDVRDKGYYDWHPFLGRELTGKTLGIIGYGAIGQKVARIATGFDMTVLVHTRSGTSDCDEMVTYVPIEKLLKESDIVSLHLPLTEKTEDLIGRHELQQMKNRSILINTARGGLVDQEALVEALSTGVIEGAGLDDILLGCESAAQLRQMDNVVLTPHTGFNTREALIVKTEDCLDNVAAFIKGCPKNILNH